MPKASTNKYFVGKLSEAKRGSAYRIFRRRIGKVLKNVIDEMWTRDGWKRMKKGYVKVGIFLLSQAAVRGEKLALERKDAR